MQRAAYEQVTARFYDWEILGRGWLEYPYPVQIEPPYYPFFYHETPMLSTEYIDDGKVPSIFKRIGNLFKKKDTAIVEETNDIVPYLVEDRPELVAFTISLPKGYKIGMAETEQWLIMLSGCRYPVSFEIIAGYQSIAIQCVCRKPDAAHFTGIVQAYFPGCSIKENNDLLEQVIRQGGFGSVIQFGLGEEFMRPLATVKSFDPDPLTGLLATLEQVREGEHIVVQVLFRETMNPWAESIMRSVTDNEGDAFFADAPEMVPLAKEKVSAPLFAVCMSIMGTAKGQEQAHNLSMRAGDSFVRIYNSPTNSLILTNTNISHEDHIDDLVFRESHRLGMLLNVKELATIVHLPSGTITSTKLERTHRKTKATPPITQGHELILGINEHQGKDKEVTVSAGQRLKHTHLIGATGTGKSTLFLRMISQDIQQGNGIAVLDPHGDLIENILPHIPAHRRNDVLIIDPADRDYPVGFNFFTAHSETEKDILSSDLVAVFKRLSTSWGDQMNSVLANAILAFLESTEGGTMIDLRRFLVEKAFRDKFLRTVNDTSIQYYWQKEYPLLKTNSIGPILTRLDTFLRPKLIRNMVAQKKSLDFEQLLDTQKIILVKLSQGLIGNENSYLLGTVIVSKIHQAAMARQAKEDRKDFFIYIDEFQNFITPSMSAILSGARKYHVGLVLAHQDMTQLTKYDSELASAIVANAGTRICFRLGDTDAKRFASGFSSFEPQDFENLGTGEAIARIERPDYDFSLKTVPLSPVDPREAEAIEVAVIGLSRAKYGTPREEVEASLQELAIEPDEVLTVVQPKPQSQSQPTREEVIQELSETPPEPIETIAPDIERIQRRKELTQHRYIQTLIKKMAESRGYKALLEQPTPDGNGRIDIALERNGKKIACEVCVTTETNWELHNIEKCLAAGYDLVVECSSERKTLEAIRKKIEATLSKELLDKVMLFEPEELFQYLDQELAKEASSETRIKGYRVSVSYKPQGAQQAKEKSDAILKAVTDEMKRKKEHDHTSQ